MTPLTIKQGDTWEVQVGWYQPQANGLLDADLTNPVDITGYEARLWIVPQGSSVGSPALELTSSPAAGLTVNGPAGTIDVYATPTQTRALTGRSWYWEIEISNGTDTHTLDEGPVSVIPEVIT